MPVFSESRTPGIPDSHADLLSRPLYAHLVTIRPDGTPQVSPMWVEWDGEFLLFSNTTTAYKYRNITGNPLVGVSIIDPDLPRRYLEVGGRVERIEPDPDGRFYLRLAARYGRPVTSTPADAQYRVIYHVRPTRVFARTAQACPSAASLP
jgi:PPOX class probable F420-dependent enzyme